MRAALLLSLLLCSSAFASPTLTSDPFPAGPNQPTSCIVDASGRSVPCVLKPTGTGAVFVSADLTGLPSPGVYSVVVTVSNFSAASCSGSGSTVTCSGGGGSVTSPAVVLTLSSSAAPVAATLHIAWP